MEERKQLQTGVGEKEKWNQNFGKGEEIFEIPRSHSVCLPSLSQASLNVVPTGPTQSEDSRWCGTERGVVAARPTNRDPTEEIGCWQFSGKLTIFFGALMTSDSNGNRR